MSSNKEHEEVLADVRKAYRLLYQFQRKVLDLMTYISDYYSLIYKGGTSWYSSSSPKDGKGNLSDWAWDWLNFYLYEFHFGELHNGKHKFSIVLQSDSGAWINDAEERDVQKFANADISKTRLFFITGSKDEWNIKDMIDTFADAKEEVQSEKDINNMLGKSYNLVDFFDEDSVKANLDDFATFCKRHEINMFP
ncbi:MAG: hypothetical protein JXR48_15250 [Candidatus Delongbacteria bacterium]|nr:hypothetical protein [Candidatus Delongbacteria bacterium]